MNVATASTPPAVRPSEARGGLADPRGRTRRTRAVRTRHRRSVRALASLIAVWLGLAFAPATLRANDPLTDLLAPDAPAEAPAAESESIDVAATPVTDADIRRRLLGIYGALDTLDRLEVDVESGIVTLGGVADTAAAAERASEIASQVEGVVEVIDESSVDTDVGRRLRATLERLRANALALLAALPVFLLALGVIAAFWWLGRRVGARRGLFRSIAPNGFIAELLGGLARVLVVLLGLFLALSLLDATSIIGTVLGAAGIVGLAVGFAVRDTVENYIASILLSLRTPFLARDYVAIGEHEGIVARLTSRATILITLDGNHIRIPNAVVFKSTIVNYTREPERRLVFNVGVDTGLELADAQQVALEAIHEVPGVLAEPPAQVLVQELGDSSVALEISAWMNQERHDFRRVRSEAIRRVKQAYDAAGVVMPEPIYRINLDTRGGPAPEFVGTVAESDGPGAEREGAGAPRDGGDASGGSGDGVGATRDGAPRTPAPTAADADGGEERAVTSPAARDAARRRDPGGADEVGDTSTDRSIQKTLEREIDRREAENLLDGNAPRE